MPFTVELQQKTKAGFLANFDRRLRRFAQKEEQARRAAAERATEVTRGAFVYKRPPNAPPRAGRSSTGGRMRRSLVWKVRGDAVRFDVQGADRTAPQWIIQEIGTGERARMRIAGKTYRRGRPTAGDASIRTVKPQRGRRISSSLVFATGPRGTYSPPGPQTHQQLYLRSQVRGAPLNVAHGRRQMYITREVKGQHMVQRGGKAGFREYRSSVLAAARRTFDPRQSGP